MRRTTLTQLAENPDLISGIYNYCDRWCERCPFTSRCLVYATEQVDDDRFSPESRDLSNEAFWRRLSTIFQETREMVEEWAKEAGIDLKAIPDDDYVQTRKRKRQQVDHHPLAKAGKKYASATTDWFREFDQTLELSDVKAPESDFEKAEQLQDAREIIYWYQYQIALKTMRALSGKNDEEKFADDGTAFPKDSDGSAKVALIGIDRSIAAWRLVQLAVENRSPSIIVLILQLERLRQRIEKVFPDARNFIRPGFDEILGEAN
jgi:hypothetical protein